MNKALNKHKIKLYLCEYSVTVTFLTFDCYVRCSRSQKSKDYEPVYSFICGVKGWIVHLSAVTLCREKLFWGIYHNLMNVDNSKWHNQYFKGVNINSKKCFLWFLGVNMLQSIAKKNIQILLTREVISSHHCLYWYTITCTLSNKQCSIHFYSFTQNCTL